MYRREFEAGLYCHLGQWSHVHLAGIALERGSVPTRRLGGHGWLCVRSQGMTPIVAHPERQSFFANDPTRLRSLLEAGAWLQITVDSLLGNHGRAPAASGEDLLRTYSGGGARYRRSQLAAFLRIVGWLHLGTGAAGCRGAEGSYRREDQVLATLIGRAHQVLLKIGHANNGFFGFVVWSMRRPTAEPGVVPLHE